MVNRLIVRHALLIIVLMNVNFKTKINTTKERKLFCEINKSKSGSKTWGRECVSQAGISRQHVRFTGVGCSRWKGRVLEGDGKRGRP